jgi:hypothetical protein
MTLLLETPGEICALAAISIEKRPRVYWSKLGEFLSSRGLTQDGDFNKVRLKSEF